MSLIKNIYIEKVIIILFYTIIILFIIEVLFRSFILPHKSLYLDSNNDARPKHFLVDDWISEGLVIKDGQRMHKNDIKGEYDNLDDYHIALVGDSVAFGNFLATNNTLAYLLDQKSTNVTITNYGVPGYNIYDYFDVIKQLEINKYDLILYQLTKNDITLASTGMYSLLRNDDEVIVRYNEINTDTVSQIKLFLQRYLKSIYVVASMFKNRNNDHHVNYTKATYKEAAKSKCLNEIQKEYESHIEIETFLNQAYAKKKYTQKMIKVINETNEFVTNNLKSKMILIPTWNYYELNNVSSSSYRTFILELKNSGIDIPSNLIHKDTYKDYKKCGYWGDPGHPGPKYNYDLSVILIEKIRALKKMNNID